MEILKKLAENLDDKIKLKGIMEMVDGLIIEKLLTEGYKALEKKQPEIAAEVLQLASEYLEKDKAGMVHEAADLIAEIIKRIFVSGS